MDTVFQKLDDLTTNQTELIKLKIYKKTADIATFLIVKIILFFLVGLCLLFLHIGISIWIGDLLNNRHFGFLIVSLFYGIISILVLNVIYRPLQSKIRSLLLTDILKDEKL
jgi:hypothetical protein